MAIALVAFGFSVAGFIREYRFAVTLRDSEEDLIAALRGFDTQDLPWSAQDLRGLVTTCATLQLESPLVRVVPRYREELAQSCQAIAAAVLADSPAHARARAAALVSAGPALTPAAYAQAQDSAPFEPWPLGTRLLAIGHAFDDSVPDALLPLIAADADRAMREAWGRKILAGLYVGQPSLRPLLTDVAGRRPADEQRAFLAATRTEASGND